MRLRSQSKSRELVRKSYCITMSSSTSSTSEPLASSSSRQSGRARAPPARFGVQATFPTRKKRKVHFETTRDSKKSKKLTHAEKKQKRKEMLQK